MSVALALCIGAATAGVIAAALSFAWERRRRSLFGRAMHELRRPLNALALAAGPRNAEVTQIDLAVTALDDAERAIHGGRARLRLRHTEARLLAGESVERLRFAAAAAGRSVCIMPGGDGVAVLVDPVRVSRAIDNLVANALEHGDGTVSVRAWAVGGWVRIEVADEGRARVRAEGARGGRGHGLRIAREAAKAHGGRLEIRAGSGGSCYGIVLPAFSRALAGVAEAA